MKKNKNRRLIVVVSLLFVAIIIVGLTAAAVSARRYVNLGIDSFLSQIATIATEPVTQEDDLYDGTSIIVLSVLRDSELLDISVTLDSHPEDVSHGFLRIQSAPFKMNFSSTYSRNLTLGTRLCCQRI